MNEMEERRRTIEARRAMGAEAILDLDHSIGLRSHTGPEKLVEFFERFSEDGEAWRVALLSPAEALTLMSEAGEDWGSLEMVRDLIYWCRRAVGLPEDLISRVEEEQAIDIAGLLK